MSVPIDSDIDYHGEYTGEEVDQEPPTQQMRQPAQPIYQQQSQIVVPVQRSPSGQIQAPAYSAHLQMQQPAVVGLPQRQIAPPILMPQEYRQIGPPTTMPQEHLQNGPLTSMSQGQRQIGPPILTPQAEEQQQAHGAQPGMQRAYPATGFTHGRPSQQVALQRLSMPSDESRIVANPTMQQQRRVGAVPHRQTLMVPAQQVQQPFALSPVQQVGQSSASMQQPQSGMFVVPGQPGRRALAVPTQQPVPRVPGQPPTLSSTQTTNLAQAHHP
jgi:hypothetical protein